MSPYTPPRPNSQLRERGLAVVEINGKTRPAVVFRIFKDEERALIIYGTGTERDEFAVIKVTDRSATGRALGLTKTTYFYGDALRSVKLSHLKASTGYCPPALFLQMRSLIDGALAVRTGSELAKDLATDAVPTPKEQGSVPL